MFCSDVTIERDRTLARIVALFFIAMCLWMSACSGGGSATGNSIPQPPPVNNPAPTAGSVAPQAVVVGSASTVITVTGSNFISTSVVKWNGTNLPTTFVSNTQLTATISTNLLATTGTALISVANPAPGGGNSGTLNFAVENGVPLVNSITPGNVSAGGVTFALTVSGSQFVSGATIHWNGTALTTSFVSGTELTATISSAMIQMAGSAQITVTNPAPGGGVSTPMSLVIDATVAKFAYVAHYSKNAISMYVVDSANGTLSPNGYVMTGNGPCFMSIDMTGKFVYAVNYSSNNVSAYRVETSGRLTEIAGSPFAVGVGPWGSVIDPSNNFLLVANWDANNVSVMRIDPATGALSAVPGSPFATGTWPVVPAFDPAGKFALVANYGSDSVSVYNFDGASGSLSPVANSPFAAGAYPSGLTVDATGKFVSVLNSDAVGMVSTFAMDANGALSPAGSVQTGSYPQTLIRTRDGRFAYALNYSSDDISAYSIQADGSFSPVSGSPVALPKATVPTGAALDSNGELLLVTSYQTGKTVMHAFRIDSASGSLTLASTVDTPDRGFGVVIAEGPSAASVSSEFAFAVDAASSSITSFKVDHNSGALSVAGTAATKISPKGLATHPYLGFVYVANSGSNTISGYNVDASGSLAMVGETPAGTNPVALSIEPSGRFLYAVNAGTNNISVFSIDSATGALTAIGSVASGQGPSGISIDPTVRWAYVSTAGAQGIDRFAIDLNTGMLTNRVALPGVYQAPSLLTVDPRARAVYIVRSNELLSNRIYMPDGSLMGAGAATLPANSASTLATDPMGRFLYVAVSGSNSIEMFALAPQTGSVTAIGSVTITSPTALAVDSCGEYLYVASATTGQIAVFAINPTSGLLTQLTNVAPSANAAAFASPTLTSVTVSRKVQ